MLTAPATATDARASRSMRSIPRARGEHACGSSGAFARGASGDPHASVAVVSVERLELDARIRLSRIERGIAFGALDRSNGGRERGGDGAPRVRSASYARRASREEVEGVIETPGREGGARVADGAASEEEELEVESRGTYASEDSEDGFVESGEDRSSDRETDGARYARTPRREEASE